MTVPFKEEIMYPIIKEFLISEKRCTRASEGVSFSYIKGWRIDVAGIIGAKIYAVEAKPKLDFNSFSTALMQARYYRKACTHVFICLPKPRKESEDELLEHINGLCRQEGVGIILFDKNQIKIEQLRDADRSQVDLDLYFKVMQQLTSETPSGKIQGARVFLVRDLCFFLSKGKNSEVELQKQFFSEIPKDKKEYWRAQYINPRTSPDRTLEATLVASMEMGFVARNDEDNLYLTALGKSLVNIIDTSKVKTKSLGKAVKAFFHAYSQKYPEVRAALLELREFGARMLFGSNECTICGFKKSFWYNRAIIRENSVLCPSCKGEIDPNSKKLSLVSRLNLKLGYDPYLQLAFWINSGVLPIGTYSRNRELEYMW